MPATAAKKQQQKPASDEGLFASPQKRTVVLCLLLAVGTLALYNPVVRHGFINCDDDRYITQNPHIQAGLTWTTVEWAMTSTAQGGFWHPLTWISHALDYQLFRLNPAGHHFTSELIHTCNAVLLFLLLAYGTGRWGCSLMVAALFAVHPLNVESVSWAAERKNVLSTLFFLAAIGAYGWYALAPNWKRYALVAWLFLCALASKPMAVTLPFVLLLLDYWPLGRIRDRSRTSALLTKAAPLRDLLLEKVPLLALSAAVCAITLTAQRAGGAVRSSSQFPISVRIQNAVAAYTGYLQKLFWPTHLAPLYPHPGNSLPFWQIVLSALVLLVITAVIVRFRSRRHLLVGWLFFLGTLIPAIGLVQVGYQAMADRFAYVPEVGIFVVVVWTGAEVTDYLRITPVARVVVMVCVLAALAWMTRVQLGYWGDSYTLWEHTLAVTRNNFIAEDNMGGALVLLNRPDDAYAHFQAAARINPSDPVSQLNLGVYRQKNGQLRNAIAQYQRVIALTSDAALLSLTYSNLGVAYRALGDDTEARTAYEQALRIDPGYALARRGLDALSSTR